MPSLRTRPATCSPPSSSSYHCPIPMISPILICPNTKASLRLGITGVPFRRNARLSPQRWWRRPACRRLCCQYHHPARAKDMEWDLKTRGISALVVEPLPARWPPGESHSNRPESHSLTASEIFRAGQDISVVCEPQPVSDPAQGGWIHRGVHSTRTAFCLD